MSTTGGAETTTTIYLTTSSTIRMSQQWITRNPLYAKQMAYVPPYQPFKYELDDSDLYPCTDKDCYERGNFHTGCESCLKFKEEFVRVSKDKF